MNEGFTGTEDEDVFSKYQIHIAERGTETHAEPDQVEEEAAAGEEAVAGEEAMRERNLLKRRLLLLEEEDYIPRMLLSKLLPI